MTKYPRRFDSGLLKEAYLLVAPLFEGKKFVRYAINIGS